MNQEPVKEYTAKEVEELMDWLDELTLAQLDFLKGTYNEYLQCNAQEMGQMYVH